MVRLALTRLDESQEAEFCESPVEEGSGKKGSIVSHMFVYKRGVLIEVYLLSGGFINFGGFWLYGSFV